MVIGMKQGLFQEKAVESLSAPEQLDQRIKMISPGAWIIFAAIVTGVTAAFLWLFLGTVSSGVDYDGVVFDYNDVLSIRAQQNGLLEDVLVEEGDSVSKGDIIAGIYNEETIEKISILRKKQRKFSKKSKKYKKYEEKINNYRAEYMLRSTSDGTVQTIQLSGQSINKGEVIAVIVPRREYSYQEVYIYVPKDEVGALEVGMEAQITPSYVTREEYGYVEGVISDIDENIVTNNHIIKRMGTTDYVDELIESKNCVEVTIQLNINETGNGGYVWSNPKGESLSIKSGDSCTVRIIKQEYHPYELLIKEV